MSLSERIFLCAAVRKRSGDSGGRLSALVEPVRSRSLVCVVPFGREGGRGRRHEIASGPAIYGG